ncbi:MAG: velvet protein [Peltula sp. TS41687]|nr:MAG: velvet protein [Peltula sp. TS41687]
MATVLPVRNETSHTTSRMTKEGRKISYRLTVIQQPERARACGSGAKSSADRRPVDPPPIVELRIFEGDAMNDITFSYKANFFLFATLEPARPIAQGRVPQTQSAFPVLTGMFVSGMAYLDRPEQAGYFLFPDLSVRHEGRYRLSFNLYEDPKEPKDADAEVAATHPSKNVSKLQVPNAPKLFVEWRLEVKSKPFTVFSAKKFPGLAESTVLSRIVAEQGCRVRIRRDVRMRRREDKGQPEFDDFEEAEYTRAGATATPDPYQATGSGAAAPNTSRQAEVPHAPPMSVPASEAPAPAPYALDAQRRQSIQEQVSQQQSYARPPYQPAYTSSQVMAQSAPDCYPTYTYGPPLHGPYQPHPYGPPPQAVVPAPQVCTQAPMGYIPAPQHQPHQTGPNMGPQQHVHRESVDHSAPSRRSSVSYHQAHPSVSSTGPLYSYAEKGYVRPPPTYQQYVHPAAPQSVPRTPTPGRNAGSLPPLKVPMPLEPLEPRYDVAPSSAAPASASHSGAPLPSPGFEGNPYKAEMYGPYPAPPAAVPDTVRSAKRPYATVFNAAPYEQSLRHGMRPPEPDGSEPPKVECEEVDEEDDYGDFQERMRMQYKRADGTEILRRLPTMS